MIVPVDEAGSSVRPERSMTSTCAGRETVWRGPTALIRPSLMSTAASGTGAAPVPSIRVAPRSSNEPRFLLDVRLLPPTVHFDDTARDITRSRVAETAPLRYSSGRPGRLRGTEAVIAACSAAESSWRCATRASGWVRIKPGMTALTRIPNGPRSLASCEVKPITPALAPAYGRRAAEVPRAPKSPSPTSTRNL